MGLENEDKNVNPFLERIDETRRGQTELAMTLQLRDEELEKKYNALPPAALTLRSDLLRPCVLKILNAISMKPENPDDVVLQHYNFRIERLKPQLNSKRITYNTYREWIDKLSDETRNKYTYCVFPTGKYATCDQGWSRQMALAYHSTFINYASLTNLETPTTMTIISPVGFYKSGWVTNFGANTIFLNEEGRSNLHGRENGHILHESFHRTMALFPEVYKKVIEPNPYLDESLAILATLMDGQRYYYDSSSRQNTFDQIRDGLPIGNELAYAQQLTSALAINMPNFEQLSAGQAFNEEAYSKRMLLATFLFTLLQANINCDNSNKSANEKLALGIVSLFQIPIDKFLWNTDQKANIQKHIVDTLSVHNKPKTTEDDLLKALFGYKRRELERYFIRFGFANYLLHRLIFACNARTVWNNFDSDIQEKFHWMKKIIDAKENKFAMHFRNEFSTFTEELANDLNK